MAKRKTSTGTRRIDRPFDAAVLRQARAMAREYGVLLEAEPGGFVGRAVEMPTVLVHETTAGRCEKKLREALAVAIATMLEQDQTPPRAATKKGRTVQVNIRLTPEEKMLLESVARRDGFQGLSAFLRHVALAETRRSA